MEFFVVVLIFISCMIALALLIYYCQEYRNPKYSFTDNQRDISAIALAIGVPGFQPGEYRTDAHHPPGFKPAYISQPPEIGFVTDETPSALYPTSDLPAPPTVPSPKSNARDCFGLADLVSKWSHQACFQSSMCITVNMLWDCGRY